MKKQYIAPVVSMTLLEEEELIAASPVISTKESDPTQESLSRQDRSGKFDVWGDETTDY